MVGENGYFRSTHINLKIADLLFIYCKLILQCGKETLPHSCGKVPLGSTYSGAEKWKSALYRTRVGKSCSSILGIYCSNIFCIDFYKY